MRKVTAGPADSGGVNDWSHLSGSQYDQSALFNMIWSTISICTKTEWARQYIIFKRRV